MRTAPVLPAPPGPEAWGSLSLPAFWLLAGLLMIGAGQLGMIFGRAFSLYPVATTVDVAVFTLYAVPFLLLVGRFDYIDREPPVLLATAIGWGGLVAPAAAIPGNVAAEELLAKLVSPGFAATWGPALIGPTTEEVLKFLGLVVLALIASGQINSLVDGIVYGAGVGLGFQVVENMVHAVNAVATAGVGDRVEPVVGVLLVRGFLGGPWSHTLFTALAGAGLAYAIVRRGNRGRLARYGMVGLGLAGAWLCHFAWNSPVLSHGFGLGVGGAFLVMLLKGVPVLALVLLLVRVARDREAEYYAAVLAAVDDPRLATPAEVAALRSSPLRRARRRDVYARSGREGVRALRRLQLAQARLAVELSRGSRGALAPVPVPDSDSVPDSVRAQGPGDPGAGRRRREVLAARHRLLALGAQASRPRPVREALVWLGGTTVAAALGYGINLVVRALH